jgi:hypothetical protein
MKLELVDLRDPKGFGNAATLIYYTLSLRSGFEKDTDSVSKKVPQQFAENLKKGWDISAFNLLRQIAVNIWNSIKDIDVFEFQNRLVKRKLKYMRRKQQVDKINKKLKELFEYSSRLEGERGYMIIDNFMANIVTNTQVKDFRDYFKEKTGIDDAGMDYLAYFCLAVALDVEVNKKREQDDLKKVIEAILKTYGKPYDDKKNVKAISKTARKLVKQPGRFGPLLDRIIP